jgi:hypothetical protein
MLTYLFLPEVLANTFPNPKRIMFSETYFQMNSHVYYRYTVYLFRLDYESCNDRHRPQVVSSSTVWQSNRHILRKSLLLNKPIVPHSLWKPVKQFSLKNLILCWPDLYNHFTGSGDLADEWVSHPPMESTMVPTSWEGVINLHSCILKRRYKVSQICHRADEQNALKIVPAPIKSPAFTWATSYQYLGSTALL